MDWTKIKKFNFWALIVVEIIIVLIFILSQCFPLDFSLLSFDLYQMMTILLGIDAIVLSSNIN